MMLTFPAFFSRTLVYLSEPGLDFVLIGAILKQAWLFHSDFLDFYLFIVLFCFSSALFLITRSLEQL